MKLNKIILSKGASDCLKQMQGRTGLTPNILSRIGFCLSISEPGIPDPATYPEEDREFNRYTLLGEWDGLYVALLKQRLLQDGISLDDAEPQFRAHLHRGVIALSRIAKSPADLLRLSGRSTGAVSSDFQSSL